MKKDRRYEKTEEKIREAFFELLKKSTLQEVTVKEIISEAIDSLEKKKIIKFMRQYGYYDYFDSSIFDLEEMIEEKTAGISNDMVVRILNERFADFALYPYRYNERYFVNRVFVPAFATKGDLTKKAFHNTLPKHYDGAVVFVLDDQADESEYVQISGLPERTLLIVNGKSKAIEEEVKRYIALQYFYSICNHSVLKFSIHYIYIKTVSFNFFTA